jgi:DnaK suppressor protein
VTTTLTAGQRALLQAELTSRCAELERRLSEQQGGLTRTEHAQELLEQDGGDLPQHEAERELDQALGERERVELAEVRAALLRLEQGRFGTCADCGEAVAFDRLKVEPWALRCVPCASRRESAGRNRTGG